VVRAIAYSAARFRKLRHSSSASFAVVGFAGPECDISLPSCGMGGTYCWPSLANFW